MKWDFFIAYSNSDYKEAKKLYEKLKPRSKPFLDKDSIGINEDWDIALPNAQKESKATIVLISANTKNAYYQREEIANAIYLSREEKSTHEIIPIYLEGVNVNQNVPYGLRLKPGLKYGELTDQEIVSRLLSTIESTNKTSFYDSNLIWSSEIPAIPLHFVGRKEEKHQLKDNLGLYKLANEKPLQIITAVKGMTGIGKTSLATVLAHDSDIHKFFPHGILWGALGKNPNLLSKIALWGDVINSDALLSSSSLKQAVINLKKYLHNKKVLIVLDDVWNEEDVLPVKQACGKDCSIIITTRIPKVINSLLLPKKAVCELPPLTDVQAFNLLSLLSPESTQLYPSECKNLLKRYQNLPLAIRVVGGLLKSEYEMGLNVKDLIIELENESSFFRLGAPSDLIDIDSLKIPSIFSLFEKSTAHLPNDLLSYFKQLGVFVPKPAKITIEEMSFLWEVDKPKPIIRELVNRGLIEPLGSELFQMHPLISQYANELLHKN